ncbi:cytochrome P450 [Glomus cerebriforme]|uniref:Cytochrome P450 n=1 Tax=Glomus cerebriforme TaxID=658196 RepID=A0A397S4B0_9GLOM|nr:cytochrome P450 [Glomus cerebriforme]
METEVNTLMWMIACLANNPGVQEEAFKELDELFGRNKPMPKDEMDLPYISAIINETLRYRPPSAFGFPHVAKEDDEYNGYNIPKGTPILLNLFAINHNERRFIAPDKFRPSRFMREYSTGSKRSSLYGILKNNSPSLNNDSVPMHMSFGAGRRYCIGQHLAQKQLFLAIAYILWAFEIKPGADENGETPLEINLNGGNLTLTSFSPHPYNVKFILRKDISILFQ